MDCLVEPPLKTGGRKCRDMEVLLDQRWTSSRTSRPHRQTLVAVALLIAGSCCLGRGVEGRFNSTTGTVSVHNLYGKEGIGEMEAFCLRLFLSM